MKAIIRTTLSVCAVLLITAVSLPGQGLQTVTPEEVGLSSGRLARIRPVMEQYVEQRKIVGGVALIARRGKVAYFDSFGTLDREAGTPMPTDAIVRIASMTKPVTAVAAMILYEEGKFLLSDPVSRYIPEFRNPHVLVPDPGDSSSFIIVPAKREITIRMLLNHTSGLTYGGEKLTEYYKKAGVAGWAPRNDRGTIGDMVRKLAPLPLDHQPGEEWVYGLSQDVLGYLIEVVSGMPLDRFFRERIFDPLRMNDTFFYPPKEKLSRIPPEYIMTTKGTIGLVKSLQSEITQDRGTYFSGGAGLYSTASDYARFAQMLLNGGELDGVRILSRKTVGLMTSDSTGGIVILEDNDEIQATQGDRYGFGLGIRAEPGDIESIGTYGWGGAYHTLFWVDPREELIGVFMTQLQSMPDKSQLRKFRVMAYSAISD